MMFKMMSPSLILASKVGKRRPHDGNAIQTESEKFVINSDYKVDGWLREALAGHNLCVSSVEELRLNRNQLLTLLKHLTSAEKKAGIAKNECPRFVDSLSAGVIAYSIASTYPGGDAVQSTTEFCAKHDYLLYPETPKDCEAAIFALRVFRDNMLQSEKRNAMHKTEAPGKDDMIDIASQVLSFCFPEGAAFPRSSGRLCAFALYGPIDSLGQLSGGKNRKRPLLPFEIDAMIDELECEDVLRAYGCGRYKQASDVALAIEALGRTTQHNSD